MKSLEAIVLVELRYYEQELAEAYSHALEHFADDQEVDVLHRFRADHKQHAARIDDLLFEFRPSMDLPAAARDEAAEWIGPVRDSPDAETAKWALVQAEREAVLAHERALDSGALGLAGETLVREHLDDEREHVRFLERRTFALTAARTSGPMPPELW